MIRTVNMREEDGVFRLREGYRLLGNFEDDGDVRAVTVHRGVTYLLAGTTVYAEDGIGFSSVGTVGNDGDGGDFFTLNGELYVADGAGFYAVSDGVTAITPYVPLYGENWSPTEMGEIREDFNLFSDCVRVHYVNTVGASTFKLPFYPSAFLGAYGDGRTFTSGVVLNDTVTVTGASAVGEIEIALRLSSRSSVVSDASSCKRVRSIGTENAFFGYRSGVRVLFSLAVSDSASARCHVLFPSSVGLYAAGKSDALFGDAVVGVSALREAIYVVTAHGVSLWDGERATPLASGLSVADGPDAVTSDGERLLIASGKSALAMTFPSGHPDRVSFSVKPTLHRGLATGVYRHPENGEIWVTADGGATVTDGKKTARFRFRFDRLFVGKKLLAAKGGSLYAFDEGCTSDNGAPIRWSFTPDASVFGGRTPRRGLYLTLGFVGSSTLSAEVRTENRRTARNLNLVGRPGSVRLRFKTGRFRLARVRVGGKSTGGFKILSVDTEAFLERRNTK